MVRNYNQHNWKIVELKSGSNSQKENTVQMETNVHFLKFPDLLQKFINYLQMIEILYHYCSQ